MEKKFHKEYVLLKDLPNLGAGSLLKWNCWKEWFSDVGDYFGTNPPKEKITFTLEEIVSKPDWFKAKGKEYEYCPKFPSFKEFFDQADGHISGAELRHNDMCRLCQLLNKIPTENLDKAIYETYKKLYEETYQ